MIARILSGVCVGLAVLSAVQTINLSRSDHELKATREKLSFEKLVVANLGARVVESETARRSEREQCAADFAGEVMRGKIEIERARKAATARHQLTNPQAKPLTAAQRLGALRANSGETK